MLASATALTLCVAGMAIAPTAAIAQVKTQRPTSSVSLSIGRGQLVNLPEGISDVFVSSEDVADVQVRSARQIYLFGKKEGETSVFATNKAGKVVYSTFVRVAQNVNTIEEMLSLTMPNSKVDVVTLAGMVVLNGVVSSPEESAEAELLVNGYIGNKFDDPVKKTMVVNRLKIATPLQVNLQVRIAEVSREFSKSVGVNFAAIDAKPGGFLFGVEQGRAFSSSGVSNAPGTVNRVLDALGTGVGTNLGFGGKFLGLNVLSALDLAEADGLVTTLAQPNLTALSGETASFLAGGEIPLPIAQGDSSTVSIEYKPYGISLAFTPIVMADGRISMRVRPEVSQITSVGAVTLNGFTIPALSTRRTETTVELGSGQSLMIGGLMTNGLNNTIEKAPGLGDVPILGALFRSQRWRRSESELVVVVTPYLVKPVSANQIPLPTDGALSPTDSERWDFGKSYKGVTGDKGQNPRLGDPVTVPGAAATKAAPGFDN